ncbi:hypothetical protein ITJ38_08990 [Agreia pratensis]|uniref:Uncharacterized protein n=1 Tax=Agreia pratensis TaxID=150121 RepID=A0A1X7KLR0_9MICO|nr:hypothetical protein [Agreia pratensis]MBF4634533.1 hypothetical protein [Agreia pratensis]SMG42384.1 hypothetical protein SAMN06296010_2725 [Agreia pratensis]
MRSTIREVLRLAGRTWPLLLVWFLGGWIVRWVVIRIAAELGAIDATLGLLVLPIAVLARLVSYIGMFLVLRDSMPAFTRLAKGNVTDDSVEETALGFRDILLSSVLVFFALYSTMDLMRQDLLKYAGLAIESDNFFTYAGSGTTVLAVTATPASVAVAIIAFAGRFALKRLRSRLPAWTSIITVYFEAVWVFIAVNVLSSLFSVVPAWIDSRQFIRSLDELRQTLVENSVTLRLAWDGASWVWNSSSEIIFLALAWLLVAGVVYVRSLTTSRLELRRARPRGPLLGATLASAPAGLARRARPLFDDAIEIAKPLLLSARVILRGGIVFLAVYVFAYALWISVGDWVLAGLYAAIGPHPYAWWMATDQPIGFVIDLLVEPVRISLLAVAFDFCLRSSRRAADVALDDMSDDVDALETADGESSSSR